MEEKGETAEMEQEEQELNNETENYSRLWDVQQKGEKQEHEEKE